ncbi:hypothetical protein H4582DRAFT_2055380 [Lactarius indigo]|nr:hypothetical protein H4582DRAFT_2067835 [Lactarius indigo]KAI9441482.1 hypothetical protein H4582DRAFT_2055380 [Lactarius indigo]
MIEWARNIRADIAVTFTKVHDELIRSLDTFIPAHGAGCTKAPVVETMRDVICATTNRVIVTCPIGRDQDSLILNSDLVVNVMKFATIMSAFPKLLKPPMVEDCFTRMVKFGEDLDDKPVRRSTSLNVVINAEVLQNDVLMWFMDESEGVGRSLEGLAQ